MKSEEKIAAAFEELLKTKSLDSVTVSEIMKKAGVSRSVFYKHFKDKYDLMNWIYRHEIEERVAFCGIPDWHGRGIICFNYIKEKRDYFSKIGKYKEQNNFINLIFDYSYSTMSTHLKQILKTDPLPFEIDYSLKLYCAEIKYIVEDWFNTGMKRSPEMIMHLSENNIPLLLSKYYK